MNQAKKRIVVGITLAEPGGATSFAFGFACWLKKRGYDVTVLAGDGGWLFHRCHEAQIPIRQIPHLGRAIRPWRDFRAYLEIHQALKELKPDAVHFNSTKMGVIGSLAARRLGVPRIVYRIGGWAFLEPMFPPFVWFYALVEILRARDKDIIVCVHGGDEAIAKRVGIRPTKKLITIPNGIDLKQLDQCLHPRDYARHALNLDDTSFVFGTIAHFYPAKDLPRYLEACLLVNKERPDARFVLIGDGRERNRIRRKRFELGLEHVVMLAGSQDHAARLLRAFDAFVLPSAKEGMPRALLEAMAVGLPCVATDVGANRWVMEDAGWIVPKQSPQPLAEAMLDVLAHPEEAKKRGARARKIIEDRFPLDRNYLENERALTEP